MIQGYNPLPDIESIRVNNNPTLYSPNSTYCISFYQTRDSLIDADTYRSFLKNIEMRVRKSIAYKNYKGYLFSFSGCQPDIYQY